MMRNVVYIRVGGGALEVVLFLCDGCTCADLHEL